MLPRKLNRRAAPVITDFFDQRPISVTGFAGCGGADKGIGAATGRDTDIAITHDKTAIAVFRKKAHKVTERVIKEILKMNGMNVKEDNAAKKE